MSRSANNAPTTQAVYFIGTSGWTYDHWKDRFYPHDLARSHWFDYYATQFSSVEINATFYRSFKDQTYEKWRQRAPDGFGYVLKAPRLVTHRKYLLDVQDDIQSFYHSCTLLKGKFELILLQVAPNMPYDLPRLERALKAFPHPERVAVEFRRPEWYDPQVISMLSDLGVTLCNVDSPRHELTNYLTSPSAYIRLHGRKIWYSHNYSDEELHEIARLAGGFVKKGAQKVYIFFNNDFEGYAPANALALKNILI